MTALLCAAGGCASATSPFPTPTPSDAPERPAASAPDATPSATPEPAPEELVLTTDGIGSLRLGEDPAASELVAYDPQYCTAYEGTDPAEELGRWYWANGDERYSEPVRLWAPEDAVVAMEVIDPTIPTDRGVSVGSTTAALLEAYPDLETGAGDDFSSLHYLREDDRALVFEVGGPGYVESDQVDEVLFMLLIENPDPAVFADTRAGGHAVVGECPY